MVVERQVHREETYRDIKRFSAYLSTACLGRPTDSSCGFIWLSKLKHPNSGLHMLVSTLQTEIPFTDNKVQMTVKRNSFLDSINFIDLVMMFENTIAKVVETNI